MRILFWILVVLIAIVLAAFAVSNREPVALGFWPLPFLVDMPLYLLCVLSLVIGTLIGVATAWMAGHGKRRELRSRRRRIEALERELTATQSQIRKHSEPPETQLPVTRQPRPLMMTQRGLLSG